MQGPFQKLVSGIAKRLRGRWRHPPARSRALFIGEPAALGLTEPEGLVKATNLEEALMRLNREEIPVVLCDQDISRAWKTTVHELASSRCHPSVVVLSTEKPLQLWPQVTAAGGYDVVRKPTSPGILNRVIGSATVYWRCRRAIDAIGHDPTAKK
jgi:DNA-binding NtrC family response regulator